MVGWAVAYAIVPFDESDETADGQVMVDLASIASLMLDELRNGSFLPH